jgi:hypothetical protein
MIWPPSTEQLRQVKSIIMEQGGFSESVVDAQLEEFYERLG